MPRFAANLSMLFTEVPLLERFDRAAAAGFRAVEFLFPYEEDVPAIADALKRNDLELVLFNLPAGDFAGGERGIANHPRKVKAFQEGVARALEIAKELRPANLNCLVGLSAEGVYVTEQMRTLEGNLRYAAEQAQAAGIVQLFEPLNTFESPGYLISTPRAAFDLLQRVNHPNLMVQYDVYHAQRMEGNLTATLREHLPDIGHIQIADSPGRNEPGTGEINFDSIFGVLDEIGYQGWVSLEYRPTGTTEESLGWLARYR